MEILEIPSHSMKAVRAEEQPHKKCHKRRLIEGMTKLTPLGRL
jgi:hypothetical protein